MLTPEFGLFVCVILVVYYQLRGRMQNLFLLCASYAFYAYWDVRFFLLLIATTTGTYIIGRLIREKSDRARFYLMVGLVLNIGVLFIFKYTGFFVETALTLLAHLHIVLSPPTLQIILPLGVSFYTFRQLAYLLDVYNRRIKDNTTSWLNYSLYVSFFPQIISGPIERPAPFLSALRETRRTDWHKLVYAFTYIFIGLYYKIAIADPLVGTINSTFSNVAAATPTDALRAIILYSIQLYGDFAGYSAIAIGVSRLFALPAMDNFRQPYFSKTVVEFWTRWHISLSSWFRDYLFFPLSRALIKRWGTRYALQIQVISYLITMLTTGLWHGAQWTFVFWGLLYGLYLSVESIISRFTIAGSPQNWQKWLNTIINIAITQFLVSVAWVFFRAASVGDAFVVLKKAAAVSTLPELGWWTQIIVALSMLLLIDGMQLLTREQTVIWNTRFIWRVVFLTLVILALFIFSGKVNAPFIYFRF